MLPALILTVIAQVMVKTAYNKYSSVTNSRGITGAQAAETMLRNAGITGIRIEQISGNLTDNYSPKEGVIRLSQGVYDGRSIAAVGIACHEVGHAIQYDVGYGPIKLRNTIIPLTNIGSRIGIALIILSIIMAAISETLYQYADTVLIIGIILYSLIVVFQLITLPVEFDASRRAMQNIRSSGLLTDSECVGARKVLTAAALTYVAALIYAVMQVLYYVSLANRRR